MLLLDVMFRDRVVCALEDEHPIQRPFAKQKLTFLKVIDITVQAESARNHDVPIMEEFRQGSKADISRPVNQWPKKTTGTTLSPCYRFEEYTVRVDARSRRQSAGTAGIWGP